MYACTPFTHFLPGVLLDALPQHCLTEVHAVADLIWPGVGGYKGLNTIKEQLQGRGGGGVGRGTAMIVTLSVAMHKYKQDVNKYCKLHFSFSDMFPSSSFFTISIQSILTDKCFLNETHHEK